jgi:hypothetical protein
VASRLESTHDDPEIRLMMALATNCLCGCGAVLRYHHRKEGRRNRGYVSLSHYYAKPPKLAYAEIMWCKPARELLPDLLNRFTTRATAQLLGVTTQTLYSWLKLLRVRRVTRWEVAG